MKKILSLALVLLMVVGAAAPAFAANEPFWIENTGSATYIKDTDKEVFVRDTFGSELKAGSVLAIEIKSSNNEIKKEDLNRYKVFFDSTRGQFAEGPSIENIKIEGGKYIWAVVVKLPDTNTAGVDFSGELAIAKTKTAAKSASNTFAFGSSAEYFLMIDNENGTYNYDGKDNRVIFKASTKDAEVDINFADDALFVVNAAGQGKVNVKYNTKFNSQFADLYPSANVDFITFEKNPSFNRTGELFIYAEKETFIYGVSEDGAVAIEATYDDSYDAWKIKTRTLGAYAISDVELKEAAVVAPEVKPEEKPAKPNPSTGR